VTWRRLDDEGNELALPSSHFFRQGSDDMYLFVPVVQPEDAGRYECRATNREGGVSRIFRVNVHSKYPACLTSRAMGSLLDFRNGRLLQLRKRTFASLRT
jgi:hypothetical protein